MRRRNLRHGLGQVKQLENRGRVGFVWYVGPVSGQRERILEILEQIIAPLVGTDGGELFLVSLDHNAVALHLAGTYSGCPGTTLTSSAIIEPAIHAVAPSARVVVTSGFQIPAGATLVERRARI